MEKRRLIKAFQNDNVAEIERLLADNVDVNEVDENGNTLLHLLANTKMISFVCFSKKAIKMMRGEELTEEELNDDSPLSVKQLCMCPSDCETVQLLLRAKPKVDQVNYCYETPIYRAVVLKNIWMVQALLEAGSDVNKVYKGGLSLLDIAVISDNEKLVKLLLEVGAIVNRADISGNTPLHHAVNSEEENRNRIVKLLLDAGADIDTVNSQGETPLYLAVLRKNTQLVQTLLEAGADVTKTYDNGANLLNIAVTLDNEEVVQLLLDAGIDVNNTDNDGSTPLHDAVMSDVNSTVKNNIIKTLLKAGADVNATSEKISSPLYYADHDKRTMALLIDAGADVTQGHQNGLSLLEHAFCLKKRYDNILEVLNSRQQEKHGYAVTFQVDETTKRIRTVVKDGGNHGPLLITHQVSRTVSNAPLWTFVHTKDE